MRAPQGFNPAHRVTSIGFGRIIALLLGVIVVSIAGTWYFLLHTETGRNVRETIYTASRSDFPAWMIQRGHARSTETDAGDPPAGHHPSMAERRRETGTQR
jgi:hypothetical protein